MTTKPTGRLRGRPPKLAPIPGASRSRGRPRVWLSGKKNRHRLAFIAAGLEHPLLRDMSERGLLTMFAGLLHGHPWPSDKNIRAMMRGEPYAVTMDEKQSPVQPHRSAGRRHKNVFTPFAEDYGRTVRAIRDKAPDDPDRQWLGLMVRCWLLCLGAAVDKEGDARAFAALAGESDFFESVMAPVLRRNVLARFDLPRLLTHLPDPSKK